MATPLISPRLSSRYLPDVNNTPDQNSAMIQAAHEANKRSLNKPTQMRRSGASTPVAQTPTPIASPSQEWPEFSYTSLPDVPPATEKTAPVTGESPVVPPTFWSKLKARVDALATDGTNMLARGKAWLSKTMNAIVQGLSDAAAFIGHLSVTVAEFGKHIAVDSANDDSKTAKNDDQTTTNAD